jgi:flagellar assembly factor FliW
MRVKTTRFGEVEVPDSAVIRFPEGLVGFRDAKRFVIFDGPEGTPFKWLQAVDRPELALVICDPALFKPDYRVDVSAETLASLELARPEDGGVCVVLVIPPDPRGMTANLMGPIVFNAEARLGRQLVLMDTEYTTKYRIFRDGEPLPGGAGKEEG